MTKNKTCVSITYVNLIFKSKKEIKSGIVQIRSIYVLISWKWIKDRQLCKCLFEKDKENSNYWSVISLQHGKCLIFLFIKTHYFSIPGVVKSRICWKQQKSSRSSSPSNLPLYVEKRNFEEKHTTVVQHGTSRFVQIENKLTLILAKKFTYPWLITGALNTIINISFNTSNW